MDNISQRLFRAADYVRSLGYFPAYVSLHGSQNYGLALDCESYRSDYDFKCIVLPSLRTLCEGNKPASLTVDFEEGQIDIKDIRIFSETVCRMNPAYLECLLTRHAIALDCEEQMMRLRALVPSLLLERGADFARVCAGSFEEKARRLCHDSPAQHEKICRFGYDGKQAHHMYRLLLMLREFEAFGRMCLAAPQEERELLLALKQNHLSLEAVQSMIGAWREEIHAASQRIALQYGKPKQAAQRQVKALCVDMMDDHCRREVLLGGRVCD